MEYRFETIEDENNTIMAIRQLWEAIKQDALDVIARTVAPKTMFMRMGDPEQRLMYKLDVDRDKSGNINHDYISAKFYDENGTPLRNIHVNVMKFDEVQNENQLFSIIAQKAESIVDYLNGISKEQNAVIQSPFKYSDRYGSTNGTAEWFGKMRKAVDNNIPFKNLWQVYNDISLNIRGFTDTMPNICINAQDIGKDKITLCISNHDFNEEQTIPYYVTISRNDFIGKNDQQLANMLENAVKDYEKSQEFKGVKLSETNREYFTNSFEQYKAMLTNGARLSQAHSLLSQSTAMQDYAVVNGVKEKLDITISYKDGALLVNYEPESSKLHNITKGYALRLTPEHLQQYSTDQLTELIRRGGCDYAKQLETEVKKNKQAAMER